MEEQEEELGFKWSKESKRGAAKKIKKDNAGAGRVEEAKIGKRDR